MAPAESRRATTLRWRVCAGGSAAARTAPTPASAPIGAPVADVEELAVHAGEHRRLGHHLMDEGHARHQERIGPRDLVHRIERTQLGVVVMGVLDDLRIEQWINGCRHLHLLKLVVNADGDRRVRP
jgi:hypothetical protein